MPEKIINKASTLGSAINVWVKIVTVVVIIILWAGTTYYKIEANESTNEKQKK